MPTPSSVRRQLALLCSAALTSTLPAHAAESQQATTLGTVVVSSAAASPDLVPDSPRNAFRLPDSSASHSQTISREEIEQLRPRDVFELLNSATGVISTQGSRKGFSGLTIRGDSNFIWIIDGAYLQATMASRILRSIPVMAIEEVKVVRGSSALTVAPMACSACAGGAPVDGFVIVRTRKPAKDEAQARVAFESNSADQEGVWLGKTFKGDESKSYLAGLLNHAENGSPDSKLDNGASYNVASRTSSGLFKAGTVKAGWLLDFMAYTDDGSFQIPNANSHGPGQGSWYMDPSRTDIDVLSGSKSWNDVHTTLFNLSHSQSKQTFWTANTPAGPYSSVQNDNTVTHFNLRHNMDFDHTRIMLGGDYLHWNAPNGQQYYEGIQREEETKSWFVQAERKLLDDRLALDASYRSDRVFIDHGLNYYTGGAQPYGGVNSPLKTTDISQPAATFYSLGSSWKFNPAWKVAARYGETEQPTSGLNPAPGVSLANEKQEKWELGVEGQVAAWFNPSLNYFHRASKNDKSLYGYTYVANNGSTQTCKTGTIPASGATSPASSSALTPCYSQADTTRDGIELAANGNFAERSSYRASLTHFTTLTNAETITPKNILDLSFSHGMGKYTLTGAVKYVASYKGSSTDATAYLGGYTRYDLGLGYDFKVASSSVRTTVYGRNLTNEKYETSDGIQDVGRVFGIEALASF